MPRAVKSDVIEVNSKRAKAAPPDAAPALTEALMSIVGKPLTDKAVKAVLTAAGLPLTKREDAQAVAALGVSYTGQKIDVGGKQVLGVHNVEFHAKGDTRTLSGSGEKVKFAAYNGALPHGLAMGDSKGVVRKKVGKPTTAWEDGDEWVDATQRRRLLAEYARGKLIALTWAVPRSVG